MSKVLVISGHPDLSPYTNRVILRRARRPSTTSKMGGASSAFCPIALHRRGGRPSRPCWTRTSWLLPSFPFYWYSVRHAEKWIDG